MKSTSVAEFARPHACRGPGPPGLPAAAHGLHGRADHFRPRQVHQPARRLDHLFGPGGNVSGSAPGPDHHVHRGRCGSHRRHRGGSPAALRIDAGGRVAAGHHHQPAAAGQFLRHCPSRFRPARGCAGPQPAVTAEFPPAKIARSVQFVGGTTTSRSAHVGPGRGERGPVRARERNVNGRTCLAKDPRQDCGRLRAGRGSAFEGQHLGLGPRLVRFTAPAQGVGFQVAGEDRWDPGI